MSAYSIVGRIFPRAVRLCFRGLITIQQAAQLRTMSFDELFARFFEKMHGRTLTPEETAALAQLRQEAGL